jgi:hypothetical protein
MGMLERYKKPGGFLQLLSLIETTQAGKREKFLTIIKEENPVWEENLKQRALSLERILAWPDEILREILTHCQLLTVSGMISSLNPEKKETLFKIVGIAETRKINNFFEDKKFNANEVQTSIDKFVTEVRCMISQGHVKPAQFDSSLVVPFDIDEKLAQQISKTTTVNPQPIPLKKPTSANQQQAATLVNQALPTDVLALQDELSVLKKSYRDVLEENNELRKNLQLYLEKIDKVKKLLI